MHPYVYCSIIYGSQDWKQLKCPSTDEWIKKMWCTYVCMYVCINKYTYIAKYIMYKCKYTYLEYYAAIKSMRS